MPTSLSIPAASAKVQWEFTNAHAWGNSTNSSSYSYSARLTDGTGANQCDRLYVATGDIAASGTLSLDLAASLVDMFGNTITFARVKVFYVELATTTAATSITVGGASTNAFANWVVSADTLANDQPGVRVRNGGAFILVAPDATAYAVTASTGDILRILNNDASNAATYKLVIAGSSV